MAEKASIVKLCSFGPSFKHHVYHTHFICVLVCDFQVCFVLSQSLAWGQARS